jgi:hypothetical protein
MRALKRMNSCDGVRYQTRSGITAQKYFFMCREDQKDINLRNIEQEEFDILYQTSIDCITSLMERCR